MGLRIRKGDKVLVIAGRDRGKSGKVIHVYPARSRALIEGVNMVKKHVRKSPKNPQGGVIHQEVPIHLSNVSLLSPVTGKPTRLKTLTAADGSKQRVSAKEKSAIA